MDEVWVVMDEVWEMDDRLDETNGTKPAPNPQPPFLFSYLASNAALQLYSSTGIHVLECLENLDTLIVVRKEGEVTI